MKQFVYSIMLVVVALLGAPALAFAQCTPLDSIPGDAIIDPLPYTPDMPENGIRDTACVAEDYVTVFNIEVPETVTIPLLGALPIDSITLSDSGISGLPAGLSYTINPSNGVFHPNTTACIQISGVPEAGTEGQHSLGITVTVYSGFIQRDFTLPDGSIVEGEYLLFVRETGNAACQPSSVSEQQNADFAVKLFPNPANELLNVNFTAAEAGLSRIILLDAFGRKAKEVMVETLAGQNQLRLQTADLPSGFYTLLIGKAGQELRSGVSSRVLINR